MKIAIVMLAFNRLGFTKIVIDNYFKTTKVPHKLLVWDNHSSDGSREWLDRVAKKKYPLRVHLSRRNVGCQNAIRGFFAHPSYQGMDLVGKMDNDVLICDSWLENFVEAFEKVPKLQVVSAWNERNPPPYDGSKWITEKGIKLAPALKGMQGSCWLARRSLFDKYPFTWHGYHGNWIYFSRLAWNHGQLLAYHQKVTFLTDCRQWGGDSPFPDYDYNKYYAQMQAYRGKHKILPK